MLKVQDIIENREEILQRLTIRGEDFTERINDLLLLDNQRKETQAEMDDQLAQVNSLSKEIGNLFKSGAAEEASTLKTQVDGFKTSAQEKKAHLEEILSKQKDILLSLPNAPHPDVPQGNSENDNLEVFIRPGIDKSPMPKPHWELMEEFNLVSLDLGNKISGAGFPVFLGKGAKLQRALINFFLDCAQEAGYQEVLPPLLVNQESAFGTGQLPDKEGQMYEVPLDNLFLIPTAEVPITNVYRNQILSEEKLPIKMAGHTPCFRREAGSYGKDVRGLNRVHQFDKVEIVQITSPEKSYETLDAMVEHIKQILEKLDLPYRIIKLCGGDLGFAAALTYDFEVWAQGQGRWLEVSSVSNFESFQSNRLKLRYKTKEGKKELCHTLNGSALALARIYACVLESNQMDGGIKIPKVLQAYTGFNEIRN